MGLHKQVVNANEVRK